MSPKITYDIGKLHLNYIVAFEKKAEVRVKLYIQEQAFSCEQLVVPDR